MADTQKATKGKPYSGPRACMGRMVIAHSPDKHPEQGDPQQDPIDKMLQNVDQTGGQGTLKGSRQVDQQPIQTPITRPQDALGDLGRKIKGYLGR